MQTSSSQYDAITPKITDICQRVFGIKSIVQIDQVNNDYKVQIALHNRMDPLTQSQQEMDVIMSLQHLLDGAHVRLFITSASSAVS